jgi:mRNA interferase MazF
MATTRRTQTGPKTSHPRRGEIYLTALDPTLGREIQKTRPALIIQNDVSNRLSEITIVAPITSTVRFPLNPVHVLLVADERTGLSVTSVALFNQIRAVDRIRLTKRLGVVDAEAMERVDEAIKISLGLISLS